MKHVIIGTAGHVDHGKTTLIQALTGTNTDRLKEEQERGMTIDIGFASLRLPDGTVAGIVDVPGHERFLKNMLAGVSGVDVVLLVIAADESVMPQTTEHLDILRLLDVKNGVIALTKCDLVEKEWTDTVEEDVREQLKGSFLEKSPMIRVSATTRKGVEALKKALMSAVSRAEARSSILPFRLPVDRVFTRPGFGTVVTGTLVAGKLRVGDAVEIVPQKIASRVRGLQIHGQKVTEAEAGSRVAVNLAGVETEAIERGAQIAPPGSLPAITTFDATLRLLPDLPAPLKDRTRVRVHLGTDEIIGRIRLLGPETQLEGDTRTFIQFQGEKEFAAARGDRFVVRLYSPMVTLGGGVLLDVTPEKHRRNDSSVLESLAAKERGTPEDLLETTLQRFPAGVLFRDLSAQSGLSASDNQTALKLLQESGKAVLLPGERVLPSGLLNSLTARTDSVLTSYHEQFPLRPGLPKEELRAALGKEFDGKAFTSLLTYWQTENRFVTEGATVRKADFVVELNERQQSLLARIEEVYRECFILVPTVEEVSRAVKAPPDAINALLRVGVSRGRFAMVEDGVYYHADTLERVKQLLREQIEQHGSITVGAFRDLTESNRKFSLMVLEYLDGIRFTRRNGDERTLF